MTKWFKFVEGFSQVYEFCVSINFFCIQKSRGKFNYDYIIIISFEIKKNL